MSDDGQSNSYVPPLTLNQMFKSVYTPEVMEEIFWEMHLKFLLKKSILLNEL